MSQNKVLRRPGRWRPTQAQTVFASFLGVILTGALLLMLPISQAAGTPDVRFIDALFTATSATCVTGLVTVTTAVQWSLFGQIVILLLIQIGGLSFIAFYITLIIYTGRKVTLEDRLLIQATFNQSTFQGMAKMILMIVKGTLLVEGIGATILFLFFKLKEGLPFLQSLYYGIFHAVSAFCNAGFDVIGETNLAPYVGSFTVNFTIMTLIVVGGIGFIVWKETIEQVRSRRMPTRHRKKSRYSLHSKMALTATAFLLVSGTLFFFLSEGNNPATLGGLPLHEKLLASSFQSVTLRTAGFSTFAQGGLKESSKFVSGVFMIIGGSPGGTAGGIKTVTMAVIFASVWSILRGRSGIVVAERSISLKVLQKAMSIAVIMVTLLFVVTALLSYVERNSVFPHTFVDIFYEVSSALGTVGLTTGITPFLTTLSKAVLVSCMIIGRTGPLTIYAALTRGLIKNQDGIEYPEEEVLIG